MAKPKEAGKTREEETNMKVRRRRDKKSRKYWAELDKIVKQVEKLPAWMRVRSLEDCQENSGYRVVNPLKEAGRQARENLDVLFRSIGPACKRHPKYRAKLEPRAACLPCWIQWLIADVKRQDARISQLAAELKSMDSWI
jgi:hypothetical protein